MSRYIKTSDLITSLFEYKDQDGKTHTLPNRDCDNFPIYISVEEIKKAIVKTPTADVVPVVHGHWTEQFEGTYLRRAMYCSACKKKSGIGGSKANQMKPYCPNCGAKMDEKENEK